MDPPDVAVDVAHAILDFEMRPLPGEMCLDRLLQPGSILPVGEVQPFLQPGYFVSGDKPIISFQRSEQHSVLPRTSQSQRPSFEPAAARA